MPPICRKLAVPALFEYDGSCAHKFTIDPAFEIDVSDSISFEYVTFADTALIDESLETATRIRIVSPTEPDETDGTNVIDAADACGA